MTDTDSATLPTDSKITLTVTAQTTPGDHFVAPMGLAMPTASLSAFGMSGARMSVVGAPGVAQTLALGHAEQDSVTLRYDFTPGGPVWPEALFQHNPSRFTRTASAMAHEAKEISDSAGGGRAGIQAIMQHVAALFDYGHPDERFYDGQDALPQLCGTTKGSCVDINAYLVGALRAAGHEAGYVYGPFVPAEKRDHCADMHCWVVTRQNGLCENWDIAHHLKQGKSQIQADLNPKPGVRVALSHSMGWTVPALGITDVKIMGEPIAFSPEGLRELEVEIRLEGYDRLASAQSMHVPA